VLAALEDGIALTKQRLVLLATHLVHRLTHGLGHVKLVKSNLLRRTGNSGQRSLDIGWSHVHIQSGIKRFQRLLLAVLAHMDDFARLAVGDNRDVVVPLAEGRLVHTQVGMLLLRLSPFQSTAYGSSHDAVDGIPAHPELPAHGKGWGFLQPVDDQGLEQRRIATTRSAQGTLMRLTPCSGQLICGTSALSTVRYWQVSRWRHFRVRLS